MILSVVKKFSLSFKARPEINFRANSESPLKWTEIMMYSVHLSGLQLLARGLNPWRVR